MVAALAGQDGLRDVLRWPMIPAGALLAVYTAFLFNQCEGRDLWQSRLLAPHTLVNALVAGAGALGIAALACDAPHDVEEAIGCVLIVAVATSALIIAVDIFGPHATAQAHRAATNLHRDLYAMRFWAGGIACGLAAPAALDAAFLAGAGSGTLAAAGALALAGLWLYEDAWVRAGQSVPLS
jgi:formate-dependent nitrite reductase membrane component NrfD